MMGYEKISFGDGTDVRSLDGGRNGVVEGVRGVRPCLLGTEL